MFNFEIKCEETYLDLIFNAIKSQTVFSKKYICVNAFQAVGGGHLGFFNFVALLDIF